MKLLELEGKLREFSKTRSVALAYEICDALIADFNVPKKIFDEPSMEIDE